MAAELPARARVVVIGGGVIGTSIAYHLAHLGWGSDVVLLERDRLTSGTTWHAAGLMTCFGSTSETSTRVRLYSRELYARLEEYRRVAAFQRTLGLDVEEISPREMADLFPWAKTDDLLAGFHVPGDGRVNPVDLTTALAKGARRFGVRVLEGVTVTDVVTETRGRVESVTGVRVGESRHGLASSPGSTTETLVECEYVVNATGMWARELALRSGLNVPNTAAEHYYLITDTIEGLGPDTPVFEDPAAHGYYREEGGGMMVGLFEPRAAAWHPEGVPAGSSFTTLKPDWDRMGPFLETAMSRVPVTLEAGVRTFFCGPESFTPDLSPIVGELGYELYLPAAGALAVYDAVAAAGTTPVGLKTLASCRMEKGYRDFGHDIDNTDNVIEVGLGFAVDLDKANFIGRDAVVRIKATGVPHRRLVQVRLTDPGPVLHHAELVLRDGEVVGYVRAASYGWTLGGAVGLAMLEAGEPLTADWIKAGTWTVDVAGTQHEAVVSLRPMYDPTNERIKA